MVDGWQCLRTREGSVTWQHGSLVCVYFTGATTEAELDADFAAQQPVVERFGELSHLVIFHADRIGRISAGARQRAAEHIRAFGPRLRCSGLVLLGGGLGAALMRVGIAGANVISGAGERHRIFSSLDDALRWLREYPKQHESLRDVATAQLEDLLGFGAERRAAGGR